jgi:ferrous iron transport protein B
VVARNYLIKERPDAIINIVDGTNIERNLYLTTQLMELGIPVVIAVNMMDVLEKTGDKVHTKKLSEKLGCDVVEISALKGNGIGEAVKKAVHIAKKKQTSPIKHTFADSVEQAIRSVEEMCGDVPVEQQRFLAIKLLEKDDKITDMMSHVPDVSSQIAALEKEFDDDTESIITNERYEYITSIIGECVTKNAKKKLTTSDKIDRIVTNRFLAIPIFAVVMFLVYFVSVTTVGTYATDWANDGVFGDGFHLFAIGSSSYGEDADEFGGAAEVVNGFLEYEEEQGNDVADIADALDTESDDFSAETAGVALSGFVAGIDSSTEATYLVEDEETLATEEVTSSGEDLQDALTVYEKYNFEEPDPADYGVWVPGVPVLVENLLNNIGCADWLSGLILDGIIAGVGAVLGFVPQMLVLFIFLAFLESCGYMARIAFIMDRIFRKFGLSGKSFIPMLIGSGCGVPGIMASRTIENDRDRKMTIMTTTFIPCGAKLPFIAMVAGAIFGGAAWVAPSAYFLGVAAIICSGIILKKTRLFVGDPAPFVMELPAYHMPTVGSVLRSMWERGWSFIKKAGTIILLSTILVWFTTYFGVVDGHFTMLTEEQIDFSILATIGKGLAWIFVPQGFGNWQATVASITGLVAKENIVGTMGILYSAGDGTVYANMGATFTAVSGYAFMVFNLLCAPCFAAMGAIKREMNNIKWFWTAIGYQCGFAYVVSLCVYQIGTLVTTGAFGFGTIAAFLLVLGFIYLLIRPVKTGEVLKLSTN